MEWVEDECAKCNHPFGIHKFNDPKRPGDADGSTHFCTARDCDCFYIVIA